MIFSHKRDTEKQVENISEEAGIPPIEDNPVFHPSATTKETKDMCIGRHAWCNICHNLDDTVGESADDAAAVEVTRFGDKTSLSLTGNPLSWSHHTQEYLQLFRVAKCMKIVLFIF